MTREEAIRRLKASEPDLTNAGVTHLYLFGSTARGEAGSASDVDLFFDHDLGAIGLYELIDIQELVAAVLGTKTDMIPRRGLHPLLRQRIEASAVQVFLCMKCRRNFRCGTYRPQSNISNENWKAFH